MKDKLKEVLINEIPVLFIGAGFCVGAKTKGGKSVPTGSELKRIIIEDFLHLPQDSIEIEEIRNYSLSQVCQYCNNIYDPCRLTDFLTDLFSGIEPAPFHYLLSKYPWRKIYSTNIDDIVETIYRTNKKEILIEQYQRPNTIKKDNVTILYKLHGSVLNPSGGYTFSTDEYINSMVQSRDYRFSSLSTDMHKETFIFLGTSYDEINLDYYLKLYENTGYASTRGKLIFINPNPSLLLKTKIAKVQGILLEWDCKTFLEFIDQVYTKELNSDRAKSIQNIRFDGYKNLKEIRDSLQYQFYDSKLYEGYEPDWRDIFTEWDFRNIEIESKVNEFVDRNLSGIITLYGKGYSGKSTYLKRIGVNLLNKGYQVYILNSKYFNYNSFLKFICKSDLSKFVLLIDNAAYYYGAIKNLLRIIPKEKILIIITATRPYFHLKWRYNLIGENFLEISLNNKISDEFAKEIHDKLEEKGYLGELKKISQLNDRYEIIKRNNDLMSTLFQITYGKGFIVRLKRDLDPLLRQNNVTKDILIGLALFGKLQLPYFPVELINSISNNNANYIINKIENLIKFPSSNAVQLRSPFFIDSVLKATSKQKIIELIKEILILISAQIDDNEHSYWNEIHAALTREKYLRKLLGFTSSEIKVMLYDVRNYNTNNFNYWIQLGIAEQREKEFEKALNHFRQAESLRPNSYMVQNAIGRNFLKQAYNIDNLSYSKQYFDEGERILIDLIENREEFQVKAYSTHSLLYEKIKYVEKFNIQLSNKEILKMFEYLKRIFDKDPNDFMASHLNNFFLQFLKKTNKTNLIKIDFKDLQKLKTLFSDYDLDMDSIFEDFDM